MRKSGLLFLIMRDSKSCMGSVANVGVELGSRG